MDTGMFLTRATAMVAFVLYVLAFVPRFKRPWSRVRWSAGAVVFLAHVICAFHFVHHWSHADAYASTAKQTYELAGLDWGGGVYFNYVFTALWVVDAVWWWVSPVSHEKRHRLILYALHGFMAFMWFNGTVVFGREATRWVGVAGFAVVGMSLLASRISKRSIS
ncbi:hypothetical protein DES53_10440 [Roseimicrobium gellanilyticum]|uniref:Uncharacterized protein n=2 Tax=Roseimicrobium gellanilyticum TaxID=748857 RepID=A0A366HNW6_9BACT|nr:hypothetical protein DES53_10440 [Roseimicrobium gellanilyticum]